MTANATTTWEGRQGQTPHITITLVISVIIPTHNPRMDYLARVLEALRGQTLPPERWELLIVDNNSQPPLRAEGLKNPRTKGPKDERAEGLPEVGEQMPDVGAKQTASQGALNPTDLKLKTTQIDLGWHSNARIVREEQLGLTFARLRGFVEAKGDLIVMVDDDNLLAPDYLETAVRIAEVHPAVGAFGGKCMPEFEHEAPEWLASVTSGLGLRDLGDSPQLFPECSSLGVSVDQCFSETVESTALPKNRNTELPKNRVTRRVTEFPDCAPIGAGMVLRREAAAAYAASLRGRGVRLDSVSESQCFGRPVDTELGEKPNHRNTEKPPHRPAAVITDRKGDSLASGGDNDICLTALEHGWQVGYFPQLRLTHLIPARRMTLEYHRRMARDSMKSYILMLDQHGIRPWPAMPKWTLPLRVAADWLRVKPWRGAGQYLRWWGNIGMYGGRAALRSVADFRQ